MAPPLPEKHAKSAVMTEDLHAILGVPYDASQAEIRHAFLELAKTCHPDLHPNDPAAAERFKQILRAFEKLYKPWLRQTRRVAVSPEAVLAEIAKRSRPGWVPNRWKRRLEAGVIGVILLGTAWGVIHVATRMEWRPVPAMPPEETEMEAVAKLRTLGGEIEVDPRIEDRTVIGMNFGGALMTDAGMKHLKCLPHLQKLYLGGTLVTDAGLEQLAGMTQLRQLSLWGTAVTDAGLDHLAGLTRLEVLSLNDTAVTDAGLAHLRGLAQLQVLYLGRTRVTDAGLERVQGLTELRELHLWNTSVTETGVKRLKKALPALHILR